MSSFEDVTLKAGHPPAGRKRATKKGCLLIMKLVLRIIVKAGGMRITQHKNPDKEREVKAVRDPDEPKPSTSPPKAIIISGAQTKGHADFPPEAVQHYHDKPVPTHDNRPAHSSRPIVIQQPRK